MNSESEESIFSKYPFLNDDVDELINYLKKYPALNPKNLSILIKENSNDDKLYFNLMMRYHTNIMHVLAFMNCIDCFAYLHKNYKCNILYLENRYSTLHLAFMGHAELVIAYILRYAPRDEIINLIKQESNLESNLIYLACSCNCSYGLMRLLEFDYLANSKINSLTNEINWATKRRAFDCLLVLFEHYVKGGNQSTPVSNAIILQYPNVVKLLLKHEHKNSYNFYDNTKSYFETACNSKGKDRNATLDIIYAVLKYHAVENNTEAIFAALQSGEHDIVKLVVDRTPSFKGVLKDGRNPAGKLYLLPENKAKQILKIMVEKGLDINDASIVKNTAFGDLLTTINKPFELLDYMLEIGADMNKPFYKNAKQINSDLTIKQFILSSNNKKFKELVDKHPESFK